MQNLIAVFHVCAHNVGRKIFGDMDRAPLIWCGMADP